MTPTEKLADEIALILKHNIRLVGSAANQCEECEGPWSYRVKEGNLEHCAQLIAALPVWASTPARDERAAFEDWAMADNRRLEANEFEDRTPGNNHYYECDSTNQAYIGWCARALLSPTSEPVAVPDKEKIADKIRSLCHAWIIGADGKTIDTESIAALEVRGIEVAAEEIVRMFGARSEPTLTWAPIETAPHDDGESVLLWAEDSDVESWTWNATDKRWWCGDRWWKEGDQFGPTHWLAIPAPPTSGQRIHEGGK